MKATNYYYNQLNKTQQQAYHAIKEGLTALAPSFPVPRLSAKELADIYFLVRMDHPEIFCSVKYSYRYYPDSEFVDLHPEYLYEKKKIKEQQQAMETRVRKLAKAAENLSEKEKVQYIHDFICNSITYDKLKKSYSHEIVGSLGLGVAVCEGIAKAVKILCDQLNLWCIVVLCDANLEKGLKYRHTWNIIKLGGQYYHFDATFDNSLRRGKTSDPIRYDYFALSDKQIFRDHEPSLYPLPACPDSDHTWYREAKLSFTKETDVQKRSAQAVKKGRILIFQWRGGYLTREKVMELMQLIQEEAEKKGKTSLVSLNWPQAVFQIRFIEKAPQEADVLESNLTLDNPDEGNTPDTSQEASS